MNSARFWSREAAGWVLLILGLLVFATSYLMLLAGSIIQAAILVPVGIFVFRGGIHLLKAAVAARVVLEAHEKKPRS